MLRAIQYYKDLQGMLGIAQGAVEVAFSLENDADVVSVAGHVGIGGAIDGLIDLQGALGIAQGAVEEECLVWCRDILQLCFWGMASSVST